MDGIKNFVEFRVSQGVSGILAVGTTGESPTLDHEEKRHMIEKVHEYSAGRVLTIASTGSNCTREAIDYTQEAYDMGIEAVLLVDPYYNGPSSLEIRREYIAPIAELFPNLQIIPYVIPGRTGTQLLPQDIAILYSKYSNVRAVKEAAGNFENMRLTRKLCGEKFDILSGDDDKTFNMMVDEKLQLQGLSRLFPI